MNNERGPVKPLHLHLEDSKKQEMKRGSGDRHESQKVKEDRCTKSPNMERWLQKTSAGPVCRDNLSCYMMMKENEPYY